jgi:AbrB family looped-hinge helix DNA binding protein
MERSRLTRAGQVTIPKGIRQRIGLERGALVRFEVEGNRVILIPEIEVPREQAWFWTPEWQGKELEADRDLAQGRHRDFHSVDEALAWLKGKKKTRNR